MNIDFCSEDYVKLKIFVYLKRISYLKVLKQYI